MDSSIQDIQKQVVSVIQPSASFVHIQDEAWFVESEKRQNLWPGNLRNFFLLLGEPVNC